MWTKKIPNDEGYYWIRDDVGNEAIVYISPVEYNPIEANVWLWSVRLTAPPWSTAEEAEA